MIDALEAVIAYLRTDADLNLLTNGQIAGKHKFGDGWAVPSKAVQVRLDGGTPDLYIEVQQPRLEVRCYAESQYEASRIYRRLTAISRNTHRARVETSDGFALLYWLLPVSGPSFFMDPDASVDTILFFMNAEVSEIDIP